MAHRCNLAVPMAKTTATVHCANAIPDLRRKRYPSRGIFSLSRRLKRVRGFPFILVFSSRLWYREALPWQCVQGTC